VLQNARALGRFRERHVALSAGRSCQTCRCAVYLSRITGDDRVVALAPRRRGDINVAGVFCRCATVRDADGRTLRKYRRAGSGRARGDGSLVGGDEELD